VVFAAVQRYVQAYKEPGMGDDGDDDTLPDLEQGVLTHNLGVPILFVVNKVGSSLSETERLEGCKQDPNQRFYED
jgi:hypothetical protein